MGDRVALMRRGVLQQVDTPMRLYNAPANLFVASFIGSPAMNLFEAQLARRNDHLVAQIGDQFLRLAPEALAEPGELDRYVGRTVALGAAPGAHRGRRDRRRRAAGAAAARHGADGRGARLRADRPPRAVGQAGHDRGGQGGGRRHGRQRRSASWRPSRAHSTLPVVGALRRASRARAPGQTIEVVVDTARIHFFDLDSGAAIGGHPAGLDRGRRRGREGLTMATAASRAGTTAVTGPARPGAAPGGASACSRETRAALLFLLAGASSASSSSTPIRRCAAST